MRVTKTPILFVLFAVLAMADSTVSAQDNVPQPDPTFKGKIGKTYHDAQADPKLFLPRSAPQGAPNILLVLIDDAGFGASSTFGGPCNTPTLDKLAASGLRYNRFHATAAAPVREARRRSPSTAGRQARAASKRPSRAFSASTRWIPAWISPHP